SSKKKVREIFKLLYRPGKYVGLTEELYSYPAAATAFGSTVLILGMRSPVTLTSNNSSSRFLDCIRCSSLEFESNQIFVASSCYCINSLSFKSLLWSAKNTVEKKIAFTLCFLNKSRPLFKPF